MRRSRAGNSVFIPTLLVRRAPRDKSRAILQAGPLRLQAAIGRSGITAFKREGDGATPLASMRILGGFLRRDRIFTAKTTLPIKATRQDMLWCDAPGTASYNRPVKAPFTKSHEELMRQDAVYDVVLIMDWNISSRAQGRGSALFFHLIRPGYTPTAGCLAISRRDMLRLLPFLGRRTTVRVLA